MLILLDQNGILLFGVFERLDFDKESSNLLFESEMFTGEMSGLIDLSFEAQVQLSFDFKHLFKLFELPEVKLLIFG
jgi:hypothetical protein